MGSTGVLLAATPMLVVLEAAEPNRADVAVVVLVELVTADTRPKQLTQPVIAAVDVVAAVSLPVRAVRPAAVPLVVDALVSLPVRLLRPTAVPLLSVTPAVTGAEGAVAVPVLSVVAVAAPTAVLRPTLAPVLAVLPAEVPWWLAVPVRVLVAVVLPTAAPPAALTPAVVAVELVVASLLPVRASTVAGGAVAVCRVGTGCVPVSHGRRRNDGNSEPNVGTGTQARLARLTLVDDLGGEVVHGDRVRRRGRAPRGAHTERLRGCRVDRDRTGGGGDRHR